MEIRKGSVRSFDAGMYTATVQVAGSLATWLEGVPVSRSIPGAEMRVGRACAVIHFDSANPRDAVVVAVWA
ncbi:MAG: hypothetical protein OYI31_05960 [Chloroflexota bacterium]|nr:hypothetical protein [Chloroflexota bacterium]MDE2941821.1 hypothetical protein [Chloroflexota bacterium]MDE3267979.1 hypothetical protein [Chloroflexota bacterium]